MAKAVPDITKQLELIVKADLKTILSKTSLKRVEQFIESEIPILNFERLNKGIMADGKKAPKLSIDYNLFKRRFIKGESALNHRKKSKTKTWYKELHGTKYNTEFKAKSVPNYGRLRGYTLSNLVCKCKASYLNGKLVLQLQYPLLQDKSVEDIIKGLKEMGRDYYGALAPENTATGKKERDYITSNVKKLIGLR